MPFQTTDSASNPSKEHEGIHMESLELELYRLKSRIQTKRKKSIKQKLKVHRTNLKLLLPEVKSVISSRRASLQTEENTIQILSSRIDDPLCKFNGFPQDVEEMEPINIEEVLSAKSIKIPYLQKIPPYTTWIHLPRNQMMPEDQSVIGKKLIYYDKIEGETMIFSDTEEDLAAPPKVVKHNFSKGEDQIIWTAFKERGITKKVLRFVAKFIQVPRSEIQERYEIVKEKKMKKLDQNSEDSTGIESHIGISLDKSLSDALHSYQNLFCRQCIKLDCPLHNGSQQIKNPGERNPTWSEPEGERKPCSDQCYLLLKDATTTLPGNSVPRSDIKGKRKVTDLCDSTLPPDESYNPPKKLKKISENSAVKIAHKTWDLNLDASDDENDLATHASLTSFSEHNSNKMILYGSGSNAQSMNSIEKQVDEMPSMLDWKPLEKDLYLKGVEIFGNNSCLISRNLLSGLKTCMEVESYMNAERSIPNSTMDINGGIDPKCKVEKKISRRWLRKRGKAKRFKYSSKSAGHPSIWKRIAVQENKLTKPYTPCSCERVCGKECPCAKNNACCEKYCGCTKMCKIRFRGCHCSKSQCRNGQCPCFAAGRECDPDVCRNCWVSCGDGSLGEPPRHAESQCANMKLLLRTQQRVLLARSDVTGWGAFLKNSVNKDDLLGEYTGELVHQAEAEKRGKLYDRADSSYLFTLNADYTLDAYRQGNKLKFANHAFHPNCYAKIMIVAGDHRVGIYAKQRIEAGEELFYHYYYNQDSCPAWCREPKGESSKKHGSAGSKGRAKKNPS